MEKSLDPETSGSFNRKKDDESSTPRPDAHAEELSPELRSSFAQIMEDVDRFVETLSSVTEKSSFPEIPDCVKSLLKIIESLISKYDALTRFGQNQEEDASFFGSMNRVSKLVNNLGEFPSGSSNSSFNRASSVLHRAVCLLDDEFHVLLENSKRSSNPDHKSPMPSKQSSFNHNQELDQSVASQPETVTEDEFPSFTKESIANMNRITKSMIFAGYELECCLIYSAFRGKAFENELDKLGYENISTDDVQKMQWEPLEKEIASWINIVKRCLTNLFPGERKLCHSIFSDYPSIAERLFVDLATALIMRFLNFADAIALTKRSAEKLFKILDVYETLRDMLATINDLPVEDLEAEITIAQRRVGESAVSIFCELENSIRSDNGKTPVAGGAVHPLTRYTMNYLKYACEYKDTLEQVFQLHPRKNISYSNQLKVQEEPKTMEHSESSEFSIQVRMVMDLLDANLAMKSNLYKDPSLRYIFLMNNGRYIVQKLKGSAEIYEILGEAWYRKRSSELRRYHKNYQRETWSKVLQVLNHEGLQVNGKVLKPILKERFKSFNSLFDEIHKTQSAWILSDEQLQSELRVSISSVVIPAYRSFLGRFKQFLAPGRQTEKYVKYQPEDIEGLIEDLFDGNRVSMAKRKN
ncbi:hypothetical protein SLEP1_g9472 [Rubroshorea leprosula]|uniref:Exocyst subunit Exo70 family protein n=1 Tax=Rubroshorea leprosula TaxID=152421 RepID=A0AAV5IEX6_9ROSI|nr:hypothetical protein SLEP1_g9472 [Rubroshorea leprosula]